MVNVITTLDENEKYKQLHNNSVHHHSNKRSRSRFDANSQFNLS
jgi:hypothetical protein